MRLELGKGVFDRIEVGTVGRQIAEFGAAGFNGLPHACDLVGGQILMLWPPKAAQLFGGCRSPESAIRAASLFDQTHTNISGARRGHA